MPDITHLYEWIPKGFGITIEEDVDHLLYVKHNGKTKGTFNQMNFTEEILKEHVKKLNLEGVIK
ncbi:hypothetical protein J4433_01720 [Candidatus Pacearchaeota archaeon]|nr:hypothetical protein [Candidatus Pacearchaeota archaeon]